MFICIKSILPCVNCKQNLVAGLLKSKRQAATATEQIYNGRFRCHMQSKGTSE